MNPLIHFKNTTILPVLAAVTLVCFALSPQARATCQQGCLTNENTVLGEDALVNNTGGFNTAIGFNALMSNIGKDNTASGAEALSSNISGSGNTATGSEALHDNTTGNYNTANGGGALSSNTTGIENTATGYLALTFNTIGSYNTATGLEALVSNTTGNYNTATGYFALISNRTGYNNTATGASALLHNTTGYFNTATGSDALHSNAIGVANTATGADALRNNTTGSFNTALGEEALTANTTGDNNTAVGFKALSHNTTGRSNIALGFQAGLNLNGSDNIDIGNKGVLGEAGTIRIGTTGNQTNAYIAGISGATVPTGVPVIVDSTGHLGTTTSSARFKDEVKPMDKVSEAILALKPVTFRYKHELDPQDIPQFGLVAEDVEKVNPDLVARDDQGKAYTVRYEAVNVMLLNEFLKEHKAFVEEQRKVQEQGVTIAELKSALAQQQKDFQTTAAHQQKQIEALTAGLQKVSAQLAVSKPAQQTVANNQ